MQIAFNEREVLREMIARYWDSRLDFAKEIINMSPTDQQGDTLKALDQHDHVSVKAGHTTGKSAIESIAILHYASTRHPFKIPCTAPSKHQLYDVLWAELSKWHKNMNPTFRDMFIWTKENFRHKEDPEECFAAARTATKENPEALQGFHSDYVLRVVDEASAVPDQVFEVMEGATGIYETKELLCGNPTRLEGQFYRSHTKDKAFYRRLTNSCLKSPIVPVRYIERMTAKWGKESNMYRIRVLGEFPLHAGDSFIPFDLAYDASIREIPDQSMYAKVFGCDIARYGDDITAIAVRQGDLFYPLHRLSQKSTMETAYYIARLAEKEKPKCIFVDVIGIGSGVYDRLQELGYPVIPVNVAESPAYSPLVYKRLRDELWGNLRDWLEMRRGRINDNDDLDLVGQFSSPRYKITADGLIVIESKDDMRKRGIESPNEADACIMTFAQPVSDYQVETDPFWETMLARDDYRPLDREAGY